MSGNTFGKSFTVTSAGESHGPGYLGIIDGCPPGIPLEEADLQHDLDRRKPGKSRHTTQRREEDRVSIMSGLFEGVTTGTPIGLVILNTDQKSKDYSDIKDRFRPGHADYVYSQKYGLRDYRGGGRASARETCVRVAAGAIAKKVLLLQHGITVHGYLSQLGPIELACPDLAAADLNPFFCAEPARLPELEAYMDALRKEGDSIGARIQVVASGVPVGWGEPVFDRLDADIAKAMMGVNAVKGVEIGDGFAAVRQKGTEHRDEMSPEGYSSNHAGGILGGISTGQELSISVALKPTSSVRLSGQTVDATGQAVDISTLGRHDPCVGLRAVPILEAMLALVLIDHMLRHRGQNGAVQNSPLF
jgi:chorismate synthase